tara:strand:+ start:176 stop:565 length:390 start_codon:yes stop_codon:yes gene_type:complete
VLCYRYLWRTEAEAGCVEGLKDRPCAVVVAIQGDDEGRRVVVAPITHTAPLNPDQAIKLTRATQRRLGLDSDQSWIITSEVNVFSWPGPDIRPTPSGATAFGELPEVVFQELKRQVLAHGVKSAVSRTT